MNQPATSEPIATPRLTLAALLAILWLAGVYMRLPVLVAPALAPFMSADLGLSQTAVGALTTLPVFMLAIGALPGSLLIARFGPRNALLTALLLVAAASAARGLAPMTSMLLLASAVMGLGIAVMQPALPALLPRWLATRHLALGSAFYMNGMLMGEFIGAGLTLPLIMPLAGDNWRIALLLWSLPALVVAVLLVLPKRNLNPPLQRPNWLPDWRDPLMWKMGLLLGGTASLFFGTNAYMASVLEMRGEIEHLTPVLFWFNLAQAVASLAMLKLASRWVGRRRPVIISCAGEVLAMAGFVLFSGWLGVVFAVIMSFLAAILLILLVALAPQMAAPGQAGRLAAGTFTIGYTLSFAVPLSGGVVTDLTGNPLHALILIGVFAAATLPFALKLKLPR